MTSRPTISDVAQVAGVSKGTVSRVLNGSPRVSPEARHAVRTAIAAVGYRTNAHARSLATGAAHAIALLVARPGAQVFSDPTFARLVAGAQEGLRDSNVSLVMLLGGSPSEDERTLDYLLDGHVDGVIHLNPGFDDPILAGLDDAGLPVVLCGPRPHANLGTTISSVGVDNIGGIMRAVSHLRGRGASRIGMITGPSDRVSARVRLDAFRSCLGDDFDASLVASGDYGRESGSLAMAELLARSPDIDAVVCASDRMAAGAIDLLAVAGRRVPDDVRVVGFDDHPLAGTLTPPLTTIRQPIVEVGRRAVGALLDRIAGDDPADIVLPTELVVRESA